MRHLTLPATVLVALLSGGGLLRLASRAALHPQYGPGFHHPWPLAMMGMGLLLTGAALGVRVGLYDQGYLAFHRGPRLTLIGGLAVGTTLALLGLLAALTALL